MDCPTLSVRPFTKGCQLIISGSTNKSDLTIPVGLFKKRLKNILIEVQKQGILNINQYLYVYTVLLVLLLEHYNKMQQMICSSLFIK